MYFCTSAVKKICSLNATKGAWRSPTLSLPVSPHSREKCRLEVTAALGQSKEAKTSLKSWDGCQNRSQPFPHPRHLFLLFTAEGFPRRLFHLAGGQQKRAFVAGPRPADKNSSAGPGPQGTPGRFGESGIHTTQNQISRRTGAPTNLANHSRRLACARAAGDSRAME